MNHRLLLSLALSFVVTSRAAQVKIGAHNFTLPDGFEIGLVAGTDLVPRPIEADFDEQGRLYVTDSSGSNDKVDKQLVEKPHRVLRLEDTNGDGKFDKSVVFADHMMFPEGCMWYDGSLYVAAPPSIWKLTDTNNDGVADVRVEWFQGKTLTGCANDLHGPYLGPDGRIYWCKGAFAKQTYTLPNGKEFTTRASNIFRARPDGSGVEPIMTGGMDNPVGLAWSPEGELFLSGTFFQHPAGGKRDGIIHVLYGGVYGKDHDVLDGHVRTGDLLPIMTHLGPAAPCGIVRYQSDVFGSEFANNLFVCNFNLHKITRHILDHDRGTFKTRDSDFLVSDNSDFHPTDVLEDADGSLIVVDTGGWYKLCCPTSQLYKPDVLGAIYRIRRTGAEKISDPRGLTMEWNVSADRLVARLKDSRPAVRSRAVSALAATGEAAVPALVEPATNVMAPAVVRENALWALARIPGDGARDAVWKHLTNPEYPPVRETALRIVSLWRDGRDVNQLEKIAGERTPRVMRVAIEAIGRCGRQGSTTLLLTELNRAASVDRALEHALIYALIELNEPAAIRSFLGGSGDNARRAALIALDQLGGLRPDDVTPLLASKNAQLNEAASWIIARHSDWGDALPTFFAPQLRTLTDDQRLEFQSRLEQFARNRSIQEMLVGALKNGNSVTRLVALHVLARSGLKEMPSHWHGPLLTSLTLGKGDEVSGVVALVRAVPPAKANAEEVNTALIASAERDDLPLATRVSAAAVVTGGIQRLSEPLYSRLVATLVRDSGVNERSDAATALARAKLSNARLVELAAHVKSVGPMELPKLLPAFAHSTNELVGVKLIDSLAASKAAKTLRPEILKPAITNFPASVQKRADEFLTSLNTDATEQKKQIDALLASIKGGEIRRGQAIFNSPKTACSSCHTMGYVGGNVGPDLTRIGQIRSERDLLEAVIFPSASFVRSYEPVSVNTKSGDEFSGVLRKDSPEEVVLVTGPNAEQHIARSDVTEMRPGAVSVMPSGLAEQLTKEELADLIAFLKAAR